MIDLKPCPFCGSSDLIEDRLGRINCEKCGATAPYGYKCEETWNTRAAPKVKPLVWPAVSDGIVHYSAKPAVFGRVYEVVIASKVTSDGLWRVFYDGRQVAGPFKHAEVAKAAAQADYERRILSALTPETET